ncbi:nitroreductase [bacterium]|nr:nitroreductase [bacterium]
MDFKEISTLIKNRKSTYPKQFSGEKVSDETINQWLEMANWAPTHKLTQPWRFVVFAESALQNLVEKHKSHYLLNTPLDAVNDKKLENFDLIKEKTSHLIAVVASLDEAKRLPEWEEIAATAMAVQNLYLSMDALGICGYWSSGNGTNSEAMRHLLNLMPHQVHLGWFYVGIADPNAPEPGRFRKDMKEKIEWKR